VITFRNIQGWINEYRKTAPTSPIMIVRTSIEPKVSMDQHQSLLDKTPYVCSISTKTSDGIEHLFEMINNILMARPDN
jgi:hypothetical protein